MKIDVQSPGSIDLVGTVASINKLFEMLTKMIDFSSLNQLQMISYVIVLYGVFLGNVDTSGIKFQGVYPYFFGEGKLAREKMIKENKLLDLKIERETLENQKLRSEIEKSKIVPNEIGKIIPMKRKKDNLPLDRE